VGACGGGTQRLLGVPRGRFPLFLVAPRIFPFYGITEQRYYLYIQLFDSYKELQEHGRSEHNYCTDCHQAFQSSSSLRKHMSSKHGQPATLHCLAHDCDLTFALHDVKSWTQHMAARHLYCPVHNRVIRSVRQSTLEADDAAHTP